MAANRHGGKRGSGRLVVMFDEVHTQLWPLPTLVVVVALALGVWLPIAEASAGRLPPVVSEYLFGGAAEAARAVLQTISGFLITVASLTFSLTVVTLQLASSQFSPRLLRMFAADRVVHATLALFLGTFTFSLAVLRTVRTGLDDQDVFVPQISISLAFVLAVASVIGLVLFLAHLAREIRVDTIMRSVHHETNVAINHVFPEQSGQSSTQPADEMRSGRTLIEASKSGFLISVDEGALLDAAKERDVVISIESRPGSSLVQGTPCAAAWPMEGGSAFGSEDADGLRAAISAALSIDFERTMVQDVAFGLRQLIDVAAKALSPGINDPTTAIHALGHASALLCELAKRDLGPRHLRDDADRIRVILNRPRFADFLDLALAQPRLYGVSDPAVCERILQLLQEVAWCAGDDEVRAALRSQLAQLTWSMQRESYTGQEQERLAHLGLGVESTLAGVWPAGLAPPPLP